MEYIGYYKKYEMMGFIFYYSNNYFFFDVVLS